MQVSIDEIIIKKRIRKNLGDLAPLMESLRKHGLINPVLITEDKVLIAGHRRLESARRLGWQRINVRVLENPSQVEKLELEIEENIHRRSLATDELSEGFTRLERLKNPSIFARIWQAIVRFFRRLLGR
jgi:ParB family chromosome partitioning protein